MIDLGQCQRVDCGELSPSEIPLRSAQRIALDSGVTICLGALHQFATYDGMLSGLPRVHHSAPDVYRWLAKAGALYPDMPKDKIALLPPTISFGYCTYRLPSREEAVKNAWEKLPNVTSIGMLQESDGSGYAVALWWQAEFGYPTGAALAQLQELEWSRHASEWSY